MITEFPLLVFTVLTGIAAGAYVGAALFPKGGDDARPWLFPLVTLVLVAIGGLAAMGHLGRPGNVLNVLNNPTSSLTMEGLSAGALAAVAIVDLAIGFTHKKSNRAVRIVGAAVGVVCMCVVTMAYTTSYGNPAWVAAPTWPLFVVGDLAGGLAVWMLFVGATSKGLARAAAAAGVLLAVVLAWQAATFAGMGAAGVVPIACGAALAAAAAVAAWLASSGKLDPRVGAPVVAALAIAALAVSRYGFYMASII